MTAEPPFSIYHELSLRLRNASRDFQFRNMEHPEIRFSIGRQTFHKMLNEPPMMYLQNCSPAAYAPSDDIQFQGAKGKIVDGLSGFVIQILNENH